MIVVTGGAGFIGSAIVWELNRRAKIDIHVVDELGLDEKWQNLTGVKFSDYEEKDNFIKRIIVDDPYLVSNVEGIIHMGACSATTEKNASFLIENNYKYTQVLAKWCLRHGKKFVYASSAATYGDGSQGFVDDEGGLDNLRPLNMYGYSKHMFDLWAKRAGVLNRIGGIKFFNVFGPNEYHKDDMRSVVHKAFGQIKKDGKLQLFRSHKEGYTDGGQLRDFVYVKDAVDMTLFVYEKGLGGIYNVGTGKSRSFADLAKATFNAMGKPVDIDYIDMPESLRAKYQYFTEARIDKLRAAGYEGKIHTLEDAINDYVKNYLMQDDPRLKA